MNLQTQITAELWIAIEETYSAQNYSHSIVDAIHFLSNVLREKSGLDGDGAALVGASLGGNTPPLKLNDFQTESEKNEQKGIENILRGIYIGIRNPRSHDLVKDDKTSADAIICFIDYLIRIITQSQPAFTIQNFVDSVFEPHFVRNQRYADLLVEGIPSNKLLDALIEIFRRKTEGGSRNLPFIFMAIRNRMSADQLNEFLSIVSEEMLRTRDQDEILAMLQMLDAELWPQIKETPRLRIENMLIEAISKGTRAFDGKVDSSGVLGTWARDYLTHFSLKYQVANILIQRIEAGTNSCRYVFTYFAGVLPEVCKGGYLADKCIAAMIQAIKVDCAFDPNHEFLKLIDKQIWSYPDKWKETILLETVEFRPVSTSEPLDEDLPF